MLLAPHVATPTPSCHQNLPGIDCEQHTLTTLAKESLQKHVVSYSKDSVLLLQTSQLSPPEGVQQERTEATLVS